MNAERVDAIIQYALVVASESEDFRDRELGPIHLIKYLYLADLAFAEMNGGKTYTELPWIFFRFGPWTAEVQNRIPSAVAAINASSRTFNTESYGELTRWRAKDASLKRKLEGKLDVIVALSVERCVKKFGTDTECLLHHVYGTVPILRAAPKEPLDFSLVAREQQPSPEIKIGNDAITVKQQNKIDAWKKEARSGFQKRLEAKRAHTRGFITPSAPRFDEVFHAGVNALNTEAGDALNSGKMSCSISPEVWKSLARYDPDLS